MLTRYLRFKPYELCVANGAVALDKDTRPDTNVSNIWSVLSDGSLEASLSGLLNIPVHLPVDRNRLTSSLRNI